jgi:hypothetical protein
MDWHSYGSRRVAGEYHDMMTADDAIRHESPTRQGPNDATAVQHRQLSVSHA